MEFHVTGQRAWENEGKSGRVKLKSCKIKNGVERGERVIWAEGSQAKHKKA